MTTITPLLRVKERIVGPLRILGRMWRGSELQLLPHDHLRKQAMTNSKSLPPIARIRELLDYNPATGEFRWNASQGRAYAGSIAGSLDSQGYLQIGIDQRRLKAHRLAWLLVNSVDPGDLRIDHINGNPSDNRISNLRLATQSQNLCNRGKQRNNTSGYKGVSWEKASQKWQAHIKRNGRQVNLGRFDTPDEAHAAYVAAAEKLHEDFACVA
jgi:hypothetical protein